MREISIWMPNTAPRAAGQPIRADWGHLSHCTGTVYFFLLPQATAQQSTKTISVYYQKPCGIMDRVDVVMMTSTRRTSSEVVRRGRKKNHKTIHNRKSIIFNSYHNELRRSDIFVEKRSLEMSEPPSGRHFWNIQQICSGERPFATTVLLVVRREEKNSTFRRFQILRKVFCRQHLILSSPLGRVIHPTRKKEYRY